MKQTSAPSQVLTAVDPVTRLSIGEVLSTPTDALPAMIGRARDAQRAWAALSSDMRAERLRGLRETLVQRAETIARTICGNMGKPLVEALFYEVGVVVEGLDDYIANAGRYLADEAVPVPAHYGAHKRALIRHVPRGVVAVISPWNYPFALAMSPLITALAAGNSVVLKPTSAAPQVGALIAAICDEVFSDYPGLVQVAQGAGALGTALATAPGVDFVVFTGSSAVGRKLQAALAPLLRPALLELGGNDPLIVCDDANLERAANAAVWGRFSNAGQVCAAVKRVYVHQAVSAEFIGKVLSKVTALRHGAGHSADTDVGPLANGRGLALLRAQLDDALAKGATLLAGGVPRSADAWFWPLTVLTDVDHSMRVMREEVFGPILCIQPVADDHEAIALANDSIYGLDAYVFSADLQRAQRIADQLQAGSVDINDVLVNYAIAGLPFGGIKQSGMRRYHGRIGLQTFTEYKSVVIDDGTADREPQWFPYSSEQLAAVRSRLN